MRGWSLAPARLIVKFLGLLFGLVEGSILFSQMEDCVFCKIIKGEIPSDKVKETENLIAINDINPQADVHILIIPKKHIKDINEASDALWTEIKQLGLELMKEKGINNFRMTTNAGDAAVVHHMHMHLLGKISSDRKI